MELDHRNGKKEKQKGYRGSATYLHTPCTRIKERVQECIHQKQKFLYILYIIYIGKIKYKDISRAKVGAFWYQYSSQKWLVHGALQHHRAIFKNNRYITPVKKKGNVQSIKIDIEGDQQLQEQKRKVGSKHNRKHSEHRLNSGKGREIERMKGRCFVQGDGR